MTYQVEIKHETFEVEEFRGTNESLFEGFHDYAQRVLTPVFMQSGAMTTFRCSISGFPIGMIHEIEMADTVRHAIATLKLARFDDILRPATHEQIVDAIDTLVDQIIGRMLELTRPGPSINFKKDKTSEAKLSRPRQLCILLNQLLWDGGLLRDGYQSYEDMMERHRRSAMVADQVIANWGEDETLAELHAVLVELDAKYMIRKLILTRNEKEELAKIRESQSITVEQIVDFVTKLVVRRDERNIEPEIETTRWSREVYRDASFNPQVRKEFSNVIQPPTKKELVAAAAKTPEARAKAKDKQAIIDRFEAAFTASFTQGV